MSDEFLIFQGAIGAYLRRARTDAGMSLRDVENESGVARSEIQRLESGGQDFRLISFLRLCASLGLPPSSLLDQAVTCSGAFYRDRVRADPLFPKELQLRAIKRASKEERAIAIAIGRMAAAAAQLLRCSSPTVIAAYARFPNDAMKAAFIGFAQKIAFEIEPLERLGFIKGLRSSPIDTLKLLGLMNEEYLSLSLSNCKDGIPSPSFVLLPDSVPR